MIESRVTTDWRFAVMAKEKPCMCHLCSCTMTLTDYLQGNVCEFCDAGYHHVEEADDKG